MRQPLYPDLNDPPPPYSVETPSAPFGRLKRSNKLPIVAKAPPFDDDLPNVIKPMPEQQDSQAMIHHGPRTSFVGVVMIALFELVLMSLIMASLALFYWAMAWMCMGFLTLATPLAVFDPNKLGGVPDENKRSVGMAMNATAISYALVFAGILTLALHQGWSQSFGADEGGFATFSNINFAAATASIASMIVGAIVHRATGGNGFEGKPWDERPVGDAVVNVCTFSMTRQCLTNWYYQRPKDVSDVKWKTLGVW